ncbi:hypothetical protein MOQ72_12445 [Saccharopolyspora sp. K220]|uniref:hypothetical protein n=1 Tax=Saccharopolyspora soli TaxID=2926618 RepID=UPI001F5A8A42|nr:hypothetical protein [Saccharopolyspora soli]MCI2418240.1 hypothetical protein [Saccharopolyspora soli]
MPDSRSDDHGAGIVLSLISVAAVWWGPETYRSDILAEPVAARRVAQGIRHE